MTQMAFCTTVYYLYPVQCTHFLTGQAVLYNTTGVDREGVNCEGAQVLATFYTDLVVTMR